MKLLEYKGKELLRAAGLRTPPGIVTNNKSYINLSFHKEKYREFFFEHKKVMIKAQVIGGSRKKQNLILTADNYKESLKSIDNLYKQSYNRQPITTLLIEKQLDVAHEYFLAILYDTRTRQPMILFSKEGGIDIEAALQQKAATVQHVSAIDGLHAYQARELAKSAGFTGAAILQIARFIRQAYKAFEQYDCRILEINPIIQTPEGMLYAGDAKITIDDSGVSRQEAFSELTDMEDTSFLTELALEARKIDYYDHAGVAGKTFVEFDGDIAVLASGGGASLTAMDAIIEAGGQPANYVEYSGNPSREKVRRLTELTLSKKGLRGCFVVGATANFTDIFETLSGFAEAIKNMSPRPTYPIVIRRAGPRDKEAYEMLAKFAATEKLDMTIMGEETPMTEAARIIVEKVNK